MSTIRLWGRRGIVRLVAAAAVAGSGVTLAHTDEPGATAHSAPPHSASAPNSAPEVSPTAVVPNDAPGMAQYVAALKVYDAALEARDADKKAPPETFDPRFHDALAGFRRALEAAAHPKLKLECLYRVWRCHVWLRDEEAASQAWAAFAAELQSIEDAKAREELIRWQLTRRRTRADWDGAVKLLEWAAATNEGTPLERWATDELAWTLFLPLGDYPRAMKLCEQIIQKWPDGDEARRAHFRLGMMWRCFRRYRFELHKDLADSQDEKLRARGHLEVVVERWPGTIEARVAQVQLDDIAQLLSGWKQVSIIPARRREASGREEQ